MAELPATVFGWAPLKLDTPTPKWETRIGFPWKPERLTQLGLPLTPDPVGANIWVNKHITYKADPLNYWQTPDETLQLRTGDCEDYCLLKRRIMRTQGVSDSKIILLLVKDLIARVDHALLLVYMGDNKWWAFNNQSDNIRPIAMLEDYIPIIAYNNSATWTFGHRV
jgi:hypothetical protein